MIRYHGTLLGQIKKIGPHFQNGGNGVLANASDVQQIMRFYFRRGDKIKSRPTFSKFATQVLVHSTETASNSGLKNLNIEKESFSTMNDVFLTYNSQNACLSGSNLPMKKENRFIQAPGALGLISRFFYATTISV